MVRITGKTATLAKKPSQGRSGAQICYTRSSEEWPRHALVHALNLRPTPIGDKKMKSLAAMFAALTIAQAFVGVPSADARTACPEAAVQRADFPGQHHQQLEVPNSAAATSK